MTADVHFLMTDTMKTEKTAATERSSSLTRIVVFQERGAAEEKMKGIMKYGRDIEIVKVFDIEAALPELIDDPQDYISEEFSGDLVLSFLKHPDLADYLARICRRKKIPMIAAGKKIKGVLTPFTCCGLGRHKGLGAYGRYFGFPEFEVETEDNRITGLKVLRGASCGATWEILDEIVGLTVEEALAAVAREVQYLCMADPSAFDPISGKSALHYAGDVHHQALKKALGRKKQ